MTVVLYCLCCLTTLSIGLWINIKCTWFCACWDWYNNILWPNNTSKVCCTVTTKGSIIIPLMWPFSWQNRCVRSCVPGTYQSILFNNETTGELVGGSDICRPCDELCAECEGPGTSRDVCPRCRNATSLTMNQCVDRCHLQTGEECCWPTSFDQKS